MQPTKNHRVTRLYSVLQFEKVQIHQLSTWVLTCGCDICSCLNSMAVTQLFCCWQIDEIEESESKPSEILLPFTQTHFTTKQDVQEVDEGKRSLLLLWNVLPLTPRTTRNILAWVSNAGLERDWMSKH